MTELEREELLVALVVALVCRLKPTDKAVVEACVRVMPFIRVELRMAVGRLVNSNAPLRVAREMVRIYGEPDYNVSTYKMGR